MTIFTIGHSNKTIDELLWKLIENGVGTLIDVRTSPRSRWPQFSLPALKESIEGSGLKYEGRGHNIGGKGGNVDKDATLDELVERAEGGEVIAIMCSEGKYQECHRWTWITPELMKRGAKIEHIQYNGANVLETGERQGSLL